MSLLPPARPSTGALTSSLRLLVVPVLALVLGLTLAVGTAVAAPAEAQAASATAKQANEKKAQKKVSKRKAHNNKMLRATRVALRQVGDPYRYGAAGPNAFDCSGLLQFSFRKAGIKLPRTSSAQASHARKIPRHKLKRGDLMFFHSGGRVYHAAIFLGRKGGKVRMVHSPGSGKRVERSSPWTNSWYAATVRKR